MRLARTKSVTGNLNYAHTRLQFRPIFEAGVFSINGDHHARCLDDCGSDLAFRQTE